MKFIVQKFENNRWIDASKHRSFTTAQGNAYELAIGVSDYPCLTRVIVRQEIVIARFGQKA